MSTVPASLKAYRFELVDAIDRELARGRSSARRVSRRYLYAVVAVAASALLLLVFAEPWQRNPTILDRAQAALLAPTGGQVLYESITIRRAPSGPAGSVTRVHLWLDSATRRFRMTFSGAHRAEVGGTLGSSSGLNYVPSANALYEAAFQFRVSQADLDPAAFIRSALRSGRAKILGRTIVRGNEVIRIQFSAWYMTSTARRLEPIALYYVDAKTYRPVRVVTPPPYGRIAMLDTVPVRTDDWSAFLNTGVTYPEHARFGFPMDPSAFLVGFPGTTTRNFPVIPQYTTVSAPRAHLVYDFDNYLVLAPTAANRRLTSVRAVRDDFLAYASGFRAASTPLFMALNGYFETCFRAFTAGELAACSRHVAEVRAAVPPLLRFVTGNRFPASSLPFTSADLRRLVSTLRGLRYGFGKVAALIASDDFVNPSRYTGSVNSFFRAIMELQADIPELRLQFR